MLVKLKESLECLMDQTDNMLLVFDRESNLHYKIKGEFKTRELLDCSCFGRYIVLKIL